eukprot:1509734-Amphidinium_carterae.2
MIWIAVGVVHVGLETFFLGRSCVNYHGVGVRSVKGLYRCAWNRCGSGGTLPTGTRWRPQGWGRDGELGEQAKGGQAGPRASPFCQTSLQGWSQLVFCEHWAGRHRGEGYSSWAVCDRSWCSQWSAATPVAG